MTSFKDADGTKWEYRVGNFQIRAIAEATQINLANASMADENLTHLLDTSFVIKALYICCNKVAKKKKVKLEQFDGLLEVPHLPEIAKEFAQAVQDFFRRTGQVLLAEAVDEVLSAMDQLATTSQQTENEEDSNENANENSNESNNKSHLDNLNPDLDSTN